jgi:predicted secreted protein
MGVSAMTASKAISTHPTTIDIGDGVTPTEGFTKIGDVMAFQGPGGNAKVIDATHLESTGKEKRMGLPDEGQFTMDIAYADDAGQKACRDARAALEVHNFKVSFSDTSMATFAGFVLGFSVSGNIDDIVKGKITVEITGLVTWTDATVLMSAGHAVGSKVAQKAAA